MSRNSFKWGNRGEAVTRKCTHRGQCERKKEDGGGGGKNREEGKTPGDAGSVCSRRERDLLTLRRLLIYVTGASRCCGQTRGAQDVWQGRIIAWESLGTARACRHYAPRVINGALLSFHGGVGTISRASVAIFSRCVRRQMTMTGMRMRSATVCLRVRSLVRSLARALRKARAIASARQYRIYYIWYT